MISWRHARYPLGYAIVPNVALAVLGRFISLQRPVVNLDYLLVGAVAPLLGERLAVTLTASVTLLDVATALAPNYQLALPALLAARGGIGALSMVRVAMIVMVAIGSAVTLALAVRLAAGPVAAASIRMRYALACMAVLLGCVDFVNGTNRYSASGVVLVPINVATSGTFKVARALYVDATRPAEPAIVPVASATGTVPELAPTAREQPDLNVVLVIVESFGLFKDTSSNAHLLAPFMRPEVQARYRVMVGTVASSGATTSAELRELCGVRADFRNALAASRHQCLPRRLRAAGYRTVAIHGFTSRLFQRDQWYTAVGFERTLFMDDLAPSARRCGTLFPGICDMDVARRVLDELLAEPPTSRRFVYWMTLNSHVPLDPASAAESGFDCRGDASALQDEGVCLLMRIVYGVTDRVAQIAADPRLSPTVFVLVGDHEPGFLARRQRALLVPWRVPFAVLEPRTSRSERRAVRKVSRRG